MKAQYFSEMRYDLKDHGRPLDLFLFEKLTKNNF